ncbi:hypothetical protein V9L05_01450 [Bernardetia sp. Wsw4-3y2]|uniref:hypothetical protein n=1 Tax=Bernardetia sp. Wsw4-3y2 TaxID=3127471 RepID=UPI0030D0094C
MENLQYIKLGFMFLGMFSFVVLGITYFYFKVESFILWIAKRKTHKKISFGFWLGCKLTAKPRPKKRVQRSKNTTKVVTLGRSKAV